MKSKIPFFALTFFSCTYIYAQDLKCTIDSCLSFSGYADAYMAYYTDSLARDSYQKFYSVSPRSKQPGINVISFTTKYSAEKVRGLFTLHYGDIPTSAWSSVFNFIQEANVGVRLTEKIWLDGGFFRTHVGTEGLFPKENITGSVAVCTFNEPYYESGLRLSYLPNDKLAIYMFLLNGYNLFIENNSKKSLGGLITYSLGDKGNIGYNYYSGDDSPEGDSLTHLRLYQNLFINYQINKIKIQAGVDHAMQENSKLVEKNKPGSMLGGVLSLKYQLFPKFSVYSRGELFNDPEGFIGGVIYNEDSTQSGLKLWGITAGVEFLPSENSYIRLEGRELKTVEKQKIFYWDARRINQRVETMLVIGVSF